jgi:hypothetical protein
MKILPALFMAAFISSCQSKDAPLAMKTLDHYPSASGIEYFDNSFYIIGDDAKKILVLDNDLNIKDSIALYDFPGYRFAKDIKPDLESITLLHSGSTYYLLVLGSGSVSPYRNNGWLINLSTKQKDSINLDSLYSRFILINKLTEINLEGVCSLPTGLLIANRGHLGYRENHLIFIDSSYYFNLNNATASATNLVLRDADTSSFGGVSGLAYSAKSDKLFLTVSTEMTASSYEDGAIGKSYLWIINNVSEKQLANSLKADKIIDLETTDSLFRGQKIESVCLIAEQKDRVVIGMVADNDKGSSTVFKLTVKYD